MKARQEKKQAAAASAANAAKQEAIIATEEGRARDERMAAIRDRVRIRNSMLLRSFGAPSGTTAGAISAPKPPTAVGGGTSTGGSSRPSSWLNSGWRSGQRQGFSFLRFGRN